VLVLGFRAVTTLRHEEATASSFFGPLRKVVYGLSSISMICVQNGPLNCKNSSPECTKNCYFETKNGNFFWGKAAHPHPLGASIVALTAFPPPLRSLGASSFSEVWLRPGDYVLVLELGVRVIVGFRIMVRSVLIQDVPSYFRRNAIRRGHRPGATQRPQLVSGYAAMMMMMLWSELETPRVGNAWVRKCKGKKCMET